MQYKPKRSSMLILIMMLAFSLTLTACAGKGNNTPAAPEPGKENNQTNGNTGADGDSALAKALNGEFKGKKVTMFGPFTDADEVKFNESKKSV